MGILCHPLALASQDHQAIPVERSTSPDKPPRRSFCDTQGQVCNFCGTKNRLWEWRFKVYPFKSIRSSTLTALDLNCPSIKMYTCILEQVPHSKAAPRAGMNRLRILYGTGASMCRIPKVTAEPFCPLPLSE
jgi:hypothetical protein